MRAYVILALSACLVSSLAAATDLNQPFGIEQGQRLASLDHPIKTGDRDSFLVRSVPQPHPFLKKYTVVATGDSGVCEVSGYAPVEAAVEMDRKLDVLRSHVSELLGEPAFLPGTTDPDETGVWYWKGAPHSQVKSAALHRYQNLDGRRAAILTFEFSNRDRCRPPVPPNPFRS